MANANINHDVRDLLGAQRKADGTRIYDGDVAALLEKVEEYLAAVTEASTFDIPLPGAKRITAQLKLIAKDTILWPREMAWEQLTRHHGTVVELALIVYGH